MKILVAGATGAIGQPLMMFLNQKGHEVYGITQSKEKAEKIEVSGAKSVILDIFDRHKVDEVVGQIKPDVIIDMLTRLPKKYTPEAMREAASIDARTRIEGGGNLFAAAEAHGAKRYIAQSSGFWYEPGSLPASEEVPFAFNASPGISAGCKVYQQIEDRTLKSRKLEGITLRFGFFYGPGTWYNAGGDVAEQIVQQKFPYIGSSEGVWSFVHIEDAAKAIVDALEIPAGPYNIVDNDPTPMEEWLSSFAKVLGAPIPDHLTRDEGIKKYGEDFVYYAEHLTGASNEKAKKTFDFNPRKLEWL